MDDINDPVPDDRTTISIDQPWELSYWTQTLGVSEARLREVVGQSGPLAADVRQALQGTLT